MMSVRASDRPALEPRRTALDWRARTLRAALPELLAAPALGLDTETTGLDPRSHRLRLVQFALPDGRVYVVDLFRVDPRLLAPVLADAPRIIGHNLKFDLAFLAAAGLPVPTGGRLFDTMLAGQLLGAGEPEGRLDRCGLAAIVERFLGQTLDKIEQRSDWSGPLTDAQLAYAARDAAVLLPLAAGLEAQLARAKLERVAALEMRCLPAIGWLELTGAPFDADAWARLSDRAVEAQVRLEQEMTALAGAADLFGDGTINWRSPEQVKAVLRARGHTVDTTDEATLGRLAPDEPLAGLMLHYREASRQASAYGIDFLRHVAPTTGRIHADYLQLGTETGRMSCTRPNLQNIPRDPAYRACFRPPPGRVLVKADYSQIELRVAAEISGDRRMLEAYRDGEDLHAVTAAAVLGRANGTVTKEDRQAAKALNFGLIYGMGSDTLRAHAARSYGVALSEREAASFRSTFFRTYPGLRRWHEGQPRGAVNTHTLAGRRRLAVESFTRKVNTPVQGTAGDGMKTALALLWETRDRCESAAPVLCVHDEIVVECDAAEADRARTWLADCMMAGMGELLTKVPVVVEATIEGDWSGAEVLPPPPSGPQ
ncbi:MAG: bifunctional 3'-5' exonuclease/DNA polymerase [Chloroflexi bacterium]|nr:bifunctional 3'-5' exonuclease/DNA polymerase [Chloroflexota bacterium]